jgi:hypothetical protein
LGQQRFLLPPADYNLLVYGSLTFDAGYVERCRSLIVALGLTKNVELRGLGKPTAVLAQGWCYLQVGTCHAPSCRSSNATPSAVSRCSQQVHTHP